MTKALYPGSFDPITNGHIDIIKRARKVFDQLVVAVVKNPSKGTFFSIEERRDLTERVLTTDGIPEVEIITYDGLLVDCAKEQGVETIIRGLRVNSDFDYEFQMALTNRDLNQDIESVFFMTSGEYSFLSSSIVKEVKSYGGDISSFVPALVDEALEKKFLEIRQKGR